VKFICEFFVVNAIMVNTGAFPRGTVVALCIFVWYATLQCAGDNCA